MTRTIAVVDLSAQDCFREVPCLWLRGGVAVTPFLPEQSPPRYVVTHVTTGFGLHYHPMDLATAVRVAEAIAPLADWDGMDLTTLTREVKAQTPMAQRVGRAILTALGTPHPLDA